MLPYDFEESIGYWLTVVTQAYHRALNERLAPCGITYRQSHVIGWLARKELPAGARILVCLSGRGDKDLDTVRAALEGG